MIRIRHISSFLYLKRIKFSTESQKVDFGYSEVNQNEKEDLVKEVFSKVANKYDVMNDVMSVGTHRIWKDIFVKEIGLSAIGKSEPNTLLRHLDVAGGTGDIATRVIDEYWSNYNLSMIMENYVNKEENNNLSELESMKNRPVVICDINAEMLKVGMERTKKCLGEDKSKLLGFVEGNAESLPFPDNSFDIYTIAFGLRNVTNKEMAIREAYRVLKNGGRLLILEFSHIPNPLLQYAYDQYSFQVIPKLGEWIANDAASYQYLVESIRRFPTQDELVSMIQNEGFRYVTYKNLTFGVVAIHSGFKLSI